MVEGLIAKEQKSNKVLFLSQPDFDYAQPSVSVTPAG